MEDEIHEHTCDNYKIHSAFNKLKKEHAETRKKLDLYKENYEPPLDLEINYQEN